MYNLLISFGLAALTFGIVLALGFEPIAAFIPALIVSVGAAFVLVRRTSTQLEAELAGLMPLLQAGQVDEAQALIRDVQSRYGRWQLFLDGQMEAQLGMIDYLRMRFDEALPKLEQGKWRNWLALAAIGAIHYRKGDKDKAWEFFGKAADAAPKETIIYLVWATLLVRDGKRTEALEALTKGLAEQPESQHMLNLKKRIANKKKVDIKQFPQTWYQIFPEDLAQQQLMRGRKGQAMQAQQMPKPQKKMRMPRR